MIEDEKIESLPLVTLETAIRIASIEHEVKNITKEILAVQASLVHLSLALIEMNKKLNEIKEKSEQTNAIMMN